MYRRIKTRQLLLIVVILILVAAALFLKDYYKGDRSYKKYVLAIDSARVSGIIISANIPSGISIKLVKEGDQWKVSGNGKNYFADPVIEERMIADLAGLKTESLAGTTENDWREFQVNDSVALKVSIEERGEKQLKTLFIGKFSYQQPTNPYDRQGRMSTYVRAAGDMETYSVAGFLRMNFNTDINSYRNKFLIKSNDELFSKLTFTYPGDSSFVLVKENKSWQINGIPVDSVKSGNYLMEIEHLSSSEFADTVKHDQPAIFIVKIEGEKLPIPIELKAYPIMNGSGYLVQSSYNPEALFNGSVQNLVSKIFIGKNKLFKALK